MDERAFYKESEATKPANLNCPHCRSQESYDLRWLVRKKVDRLSRGRLGYIFLTDFNAEGSKDFVRQFYPQRDKEGLVFDVRWNRGGFTSQAVLDVLRREHAGIFVNREGSVSPLPGAPSTALPNSPASSLITVPRSSGLTPLA